MNEDQKNNLDFSHIVSEFHDEETARKSFAAIDIDQVKDTKSFCSYFSMEIFLLIFSLSIFLSCVFFREIPFPEKHFKLFDLFYLFLIYMLQTMSFNPFLDKTLRDKYVCVKLKEHDKWKQIKQKYGKTGWCIYMLISLIPISLVYSVAKL